MLSILLLLLAIVYFYCVIFGLIHLIPCFFNIFLFFFSVGERDLGFCPQLSNISVDEEKIIDFREKKKKKQREIKKGNMTGER